MSEGRLSRAGRAIVRQPLLLLLWLVGIPLAIVFAGGVLSILSAFGLRFFVFEPYEIPSGSNLPTVQVGDRVVISKLPYALHLAKPERGDLVIFRNPKRGSPDLLKRVVAVAGDTVEVKDGRLILDGGVIPEAPLAGDCVDQEPDEPGGRWADHACVAFRQTLGATTFAVHHRPEATPPDYGPQTVPADQVFVMGDNRDRSFDSRWFGPVPVENLKGRVFGILWSVGPAGIRWDRCLSAIGSP
jgi:signal peptidase I